MGTATLWWYVWGAEALPETSPDVYSLQVQLQIWNWWMCRAETIQPGHTVIAWADYHRSLSLYFWPFALKLSVILVMTVLSHWWQASLSSSYSIKMNSNDNKEKQWPTSSVKLHDTSFSLYSYLLNKNYKVRINTPSNKVQLSRMLKWV